MIQNLVPQIWADAILEVTMRSVMHPGPFDELLRLSNEKHEQHMADDPDYARAYELQQAEEEAESYWTALYANQLPDNGEEDWDY